MSAKLSGARCVSVIRTQIPAQTPPSHLRLILRKAWAALRPGGQLMLEPHTFEAVEAMGREPLGWSAHRRQMAVS